MGKTSQKYKASEASSSKTRGKEPKIRYQKICPKGLRIRARGGYVKKQKRGRHNTLGDNSKKEPMPDWERPRRGGKKKGNWESVKGTAPPPLA